MKNLRSIILLVLMLALFITVFASCNKKDNNTNNGETTTEIVETTTEISETTTEISETTTEISETTTEISETTTEIGETTTEIGETTTEIGETTTEPDHEHNFVEGKCECGETDPNYVPPHEHNFVEGKCECGETDPNYVPPHEHNFVEGKCECGETDPNYVPPHQHNYETVVTNPTCTEAGYTTYTCSCGDTYTGDEVAATGHSYNSAVTAPTCTEAGYTTYTCSCGDTYTGDEVAATGHSYNSAVTAPTCTEAGYTTYTCSCGDTYKADEVAATGHSYNSAVTAPTCTEAGYTTYTCSCGDTYTGDEVAALGHTFIDSKCQCGAEYVAPVGGDWTLVTELKNGDHVLIGAPAYGKLLSAEKVSAGSYYNKGVDYSADNFENVTDAEIFVVTVNADGTYTFTSLTGKVIALAASYSSLNETGEHKSWSLVEKGNGLFLLKNTGRNYYLEWYSSKNNWSTYSAGNTDEYELSFYAKKVSAEDHIHNHISEVHAPTCTEDGYTSYTCACGDSYNKATGEVATGHSYNPVVTAPTCTEAGYTTYTCSCGDSYKEDGEAATGHTFVEGKCECGEKDPDYVDPTPDPDVPSVGGGSADFNSIELPSNKPNGDSSYTATYTTANGWVSEYSAIQTGKVGELTEVANPQFPVIGPDNTHKAVCLNGKTSAPGKLTSPTLNGGISKLTLNYTKMFTDTKLAVTVTVTELATGNVYTHVISVELPKDEKYVVYTDEWVLETPVTGDFTIEIVNNCPSGSTSNKDRMTILSLVWEGAAPSHTHEYTSTTTATCTAAGTTTYTCSCGDTYTEEVEALGHVDANLDIECDRDGCTSKVAPPADSVLSNFTANNLGSKVSVSSSYYVQGTIVEVLDARNGIFLIDDGTGETFYFRLPKNADGVSHASWEIKLVLGDKVSVYGKINKYTTSSAPNGSYYPAIQGGTVTILEQHPHVFSDPTCTDSGYCACGQIGPEALGHVDTDNNYLCDVCQWNTKLSVADIGISTDGTTGGVLDDAKTSWTWSDEEIDVIIAKGTSTYTLYTTAKAYMQLKKLNTLTVSSKNGYNIYSITISTTNATQLNNLKAAIGTAYEYTADEAKFSVTIIINSSEDFVLVNNGTTTAYISNVAVAYEKSSETPETPDTPDTPDTHVCADTDNNHKCDTCDEVVSECADTNPANHKCDVCDAVLSECADNSGDNICDVCGADLTPAPEVKDTLTIPEAIELGKAQASNAYTAEKYYVTGTVKSVYNDTYGNMYIVDAEGNEITVYGTYSADGSTRYDAMTSKPIAGDTITVYGVVGNYNGDPQLKNAWIIEFAHVHNFADATCTSPKTCACGLTEGEAAGHNYVDGSCTVCGNADPDAPSTGEPVQLAIFEFGTNGSASHVDGNDLGTSKSYTEGGYTLALTGMSKVYGPAFDAKGNSCIKLGTSKVVGTFSFTVADDVDYVIIKVAQYKANKTIVDVNGQQTTVSTASNNGEYTEIRVDTSTTKTVTLTTVSGGVRCMINSIAFFG